MIDRVQARQDTITHVTTFLAWAATEGRLAEYLTVPAERWAGTPRMVEEDIAAWLGIDLAEVARERRRLEDWARRAVATSLLAGTEGG
jgi:hypothetical protein